jgi:hypothetical protein
MAGGCFVVFAGISRNNNPVVVQKLVLIRDYYKLSIFVIKESMLKSKNRENQEGRT